MAPKAKDHGRYNVWANHVMCEFIWEIAMAGERGQGDIEYGWSYFMYRMTRKQSVHQSDFWIDAMARCLCELWMLRTRVQLKMSFFSLSRSSSLLLPLSLLCLLCNKCAAINIKCYLLFLFVARVSACGSWIKSRCCCTVHTVYYSMHKRHESQKVGMGERAKHTHTHVNVTNLFYVHVNMRPSNVPNAR